MAPLRNTKHERFAQGLAEGKSADEAYEVAGYKRNRSHASRLVAKGSIRGRVRELQDAAAAETEITIRSLIEEAADIQKRATQAGQHSAAIAALIAKSKLAGRWVERSEQKNSNATYVVSDRPMTEEEWAADRVTEH
jgi:terminase small subunit-like protein